jgi:hypothetical protein
VLAYLALSVPEIGAPAAPDTPFQDAVTFATLQPELHVFLKHGSRVATTPHERVIPSYRSTAHLPLETDPDDFRTPLVAYFQCTKSLDERELRKLARDTNLNQFKRKEGDEWCCNYFCSYRTPRADNVRRHLLFGVCWYSHREGRWMKTAEDWGGPAGDDIRSNASKGRTRG